MILDFLATFFGTTTILMPIFALDVLKVGAEGLGFLYSAIIRNTLRQMLTPDYTRGRMVSINMIFTRGGPEAGNMEAGLRRRD